MSGERPTFAELGAKLQAGGYPLAAAGLAGVGYAMPMVHAARAAAELEATAARVADLVVADRAAAAGMVDRVVHAFGGPWPTTTSPYAHRVRWRGGRPRRPRSRR